MVNYDTLEKLSIENLHTAVNEAFSDYEIKMDMPLAKLQQRLQRTGYNACASIGASHDEKLVGFVLNAIRQWDGKLTAYDTGTAVIKEYRNKGITTTMFSHALNVLKEIEVKQYVLEVIQSNESAVHLYKKQGFNVSREFDCFHLDQSSFVSESKHIVQFLDSMSENDWAQVTSFWDVTPSWQNSIASLQAVSDTLIYAIVKVNDCMVGYGIIDKVTGDIPQLAVHKDYRCQGIASSIMTHLVNASQSNHVSVINVEGQCLSMKQFLLNLGFNQMLKQYEMIFEL